MAVNLADMQTVGTVLAAPIVTGVVAAERQAGWWILLFVVGGAAVGVGLAFLMHFVAYRLIGCGPEDGGAWREWVAALAYLLGPPILGCGGVLLLGWGTFWVAGWLA